MLMTLKELNIFIDAFQERRKDDNKMEDVRTARICCIIANVNSKKKFKEKDFMPRERKAMTLEQMKTVLKAVTLANGGEING